MRKYISLAAYALLFNFASIPAMAASISDYQVTMVSDKAICIKVGSLPVTCVTDNINDKEMPVWSKDGEKIAYIEFDGDPSSLASLVIIDRFGRVFITSPIKPVASGEVRSGMRAVEGLEWLGSERIVVSGSINPSSTEYVVIDASTGAVYDEFVDDGFGASFSPNGALCAYITGAPHFSSREEQSAKLIVNGATIGKLSAQGLGIAGKPSWSPDSSALAVPVTRQVSRSLTKSKTATVNQDSLLVWDRRNGRNSIVDLPFDVAEKYSLLWQNSNIIVQTKSGGLTQQTDSKPGQSPAVSGVWQLSDATEIKHIGTWEQINEADTEIAREKANELKLELQRKFRRLGSKDVDIWCQTCELTLLPRSSKATE